MLKKNITMIISIGCVALILTMLMFTQFKTVDETDITAIETMRETELRAELANWKQKYEGIETELEDREQKISEYKEKLNDDVAASAILEGEVKEAETYLGYTNVQGEGIIITLSDGEIYNIEYYDLLNLVNELRSADAEAISINDQRVISSSDITLVTNNRILVNSVKIQGPYVIKAIGDRKYLESALNIKAGYIDELKVWNKKVEYTLEDNIVIPGFDGKKMNFEYSQENKKQEEK